MMVYYITSAKLYQLFFFDDLWEGEKCGGCVIDKLRV